MKRLVFLMLGIISALGMRAQTWTAPGHPELPEAADPVSGGVYRVMNTEAGRFLSGGKSWYSWATSTILTTSENSLQFTLTSSLDAEQNERWSFARTTDGKFTFMSGSLDGQGEMHVDMGTQGHNYFELEKQVNGTYHIRPSRLDDNYGMYSYDAEDPDFSILIWEQRCWGWKGPGVEPTNAVYGTLDPAEGNYCDWLFGQWTDDQLAEIDAAYNLYNARLDLYAVVQTIVSEGMNINYDAYAEAYNGTDIEAIKTAITELNDKIQELRVYEILKFGEDGVNPPSETNPCDATSLIKNAAFDEGTQWQQPPYWTVEAMGQNNCWQNNNTYQGVDGAFLDQFMESWIGGTLKDGAMYQTLKSLPSGKYEFGVDAMTNGAKATTTGVELFATGGDITTTAPVATDANTPEHFTLTFVSTGGDVTLGLRTRSANIGWMCADNFTLTFYGEVDPYLVALQDLIKTAETTYPEDDMDNVRAYPDTKAAFLIVLADAKAEAAKGNGEYKQAYEALKAAVDALNTSVEEYNTLENIYNNWNENIANMEGKWAAIVEDDAFTQIMDEIGNALDNYTYDSEQIAATDSRLAEAFAAFIGANVAQGDDLTFLLNNPSFDDKDANGNYIKFSGWDSEWVSPTWGGEDVTYTDPADPSGMTIKIAEGGNAEVYHAKFNIHQTIKYMPAGVFTLSCKAFERDDNSQGVNAELYAIVNGDIQNIQTVKVKNRNEEGSDVMLYDGTGGTNNKMADAMNGDKYVPNGMSGANVYFNEGFYENYLNIVLEEPAEEIIIGIRNLTGGETWGSSGDWVLFDDFQIIFNGNSGSSYFPTLQRLIDQTNTYTAAGAEYILTTETLNALANAIKNAQDLMKSEDTSTESALDAIAQLEGAIELTKETIVLTNKLNHYIEVMDLRMSDDLIATSDTSIEDVISEIRGHLDNNDYEDMAAVEQAMIDLNKAFTNYVMYDCAGTTEANPANVTPVIYNYDGNEYSYSTTVNGWDQIEGTVGYGDSGGEVSEFFDTSFEISQTIYGLLPGWYRLGVQGYYRAGLGTVVKEQYEAGQELARHAVLFAGDEAETALLGITNMEDMTAFTWVADENGTVELVVGDGSFRIPDSALQGAIALWNFREDGETPLYQNYLLFEVKEGQESVTIGLRKTEEVEKDLCIWDNWSLLYYGTGQSQEPIIDPDAGVDFGGAVTAIEADTWYYLYQARGGGSYCMEGEIPSGGGGLMTDCGNGEEVLKKDFTPLLSHVSTETAAPYLVRFVKEDETDDVYRIQFGTGNWLAAPNGTGNGKKFTTSSTINDAGTFNVYAIEEGTAYFALNVCDDRGDYQELLDNNGTGSFIATWDSGKKTNVGGNSVWSIHEVILNGEEENGDDVTINVDMNHGNWIEWNGNGTFPFARSWNSTTTPKISVCCTTGGRTTTDIRGNKFSGGNNMSAYGDDMLNLMFFSNLSTYQIMVEEGYYIKSVDFDFDVTAWTSAKGFYDFPEESGLSVTPENGDAVVSTNPNDVQHISWTNEDDDYSIYTFTYSVNRVGGDNGFARTSNYIVTVATVPDEVLALQELENIASEYGAYESLFVAGTKPGQYSADAIQTFTDALELANNATGPDSDNYTAEQLRMLGQHIKDAYEAVLASRVPMTLADGYYRIKSAMAFYQTEVNSGTGLEETNYYDKYISTSNNGETISAVWNTPDDLKTHAPSLWKVTNKNGLYDIVSTATDARFANTGPITLTLDSDSLMAIDPETTDEDDITYVNIRFASAAAGNYKSGYNYFHTSGHSSGKGTSGNITKWKNTYRGDNGEEDPEPRGSEWVFVPVDDATAAAIMKAYEPIKEREMMLEEFYNLLAVAKEDLETAIDIQHVKLIQSADQLSSPCSDSEEGQHIENLIDENTSTFWYSDWHGHYTGGTHYFQVEMPENITMPIQATFTRRNNSGNQITQWGIYGTNNADAASMEDCELLLEWDTPFNSQTETLTSPEFETKGFKYLRMYCLAQSSNSNAFFHLNEFQLGYDAENPEAPFYYMGEVGKNLQQVIEAQAELERDDITLDDYNVLKAAHDAFLDKLSWMDYPIVNLLDGNAYDFDTDTDVKRVTYTRNYKNKNWQALYLPFEIDYEDWANDFDLARINDTHQFDDDDDGVIDRTELEVIKLRSGHTEAHTPYLIRAKKTGEKTIMANCTTLYAAEERSYDVSSWNTLYTFTGTYTGVPGETMLGNGYYAFGGGSLHQAADVTNALSPYRWYMEITDRNGNPKNLGEVKVVVFDMDDMDETDEADGIKWQMSNGKCEMEHGDGALYDLSGRRVTNPRQGIYVRNGRKIIIK